MPTCDLEQLELDLHLLPELAVERAERLVEEQHRRPVDEGAGERHALLLAAGELARLAVRASGVIFTISSASPTRRCVSPLSTPFWRRP